MSFKRVGIAVGLASMSFCGAAVAAADAAAPATAPPHAELRALTCHRAADAGGRMVSITAVMRPVSGTTRMALKFELERRTAGSGGFRVVSGRPLGQWVYPANPTLGQNPADVWMLKQNVFNLAAPASYRFRVGFRWTGSGGHVLATTTRVSLVCREPKPRADLTVRSITIKPLANGRDQYNVLVHNDGGAASEAFAVRLSPPGSSIASPALPARSSGHVVFDAASCSPGSLITAVADPDGQVDDANRANNTLTVAC